MSNLPDAERDLRSIAENSKNQVMRGNLPGLGYVPPECAPVVLTYREIINLLDRLAEAERRGMERAAEIAEALGDKRPLISWAQIAAAIRDEAAKLKGGNNG